MEDSPESSGQSSGGPDPEPATVGTSSEKAHGPLQANHSRLAAIGAIIEAQQAAKQKAVDAKQFNGPFTCGHYCPHCGAQCESQFENKESWREHCKAKRYTSPAWQDLGPAVQV